MNFKKYHESKNLLDKTTFTTVGATIEQIKDGIRITTQSNGYAAVIVLDVLQNTDYSISYIWKYISGNSSNTVRVFAGTGSSTQIAMFEYSNGGTFNTGNNTKINIWFYAAFSAAATVEYANIMLNLGSEALPYEPYSSEVWHSTPHYIHNTSTDTITTLPAIIYPNDTTATVGLKGQMQQTGSPTPQNPIQPSECGDLETTGEHAGQYKIPISSANTTTPVYLGEVESTRQIKELVLTGNETIEGYDSTYNRFSIIIPDSLIIGVRLSPVICSHYQAISDGRGIANVPNNAIYSDSGTSRWFIKTTEYTNTTDFKAYLAAQYAAGTPVTVWYVLATPTTGIVNEPIRKIEEYADTVSGITIPTTTGANSFDVLTTLKPSEVTANYHGWHTGAVHERENGAWT